MRDDALKADQQHQLARGSVASEKGRLDCRETKSRGVQFALYHRHALCGAGLAQKKLYRMTDSRALLPTARRRNAGDWKLQRIPHSEPCSFTNNPSCLRRWIVPVA
jgi:hypothetical protein